MARYSKFTFLCDENERLAIVSLAERLQRSQSDAVRFLINEKMAELSGSPIEEFRSGMEKLVKSLSREERAEFLQAIKDEQARRKSNEAQNGS